MSSVLRSLRPFTILFNLVAFVLIFLAMSNGSRNGDILYLATSDGSLVLVLAGVGFVLNLATGYLRFRELIRSQKPQNEPTRPRITGE